MVLGGFRSFHVLVTTDHHLACGLAYVFIPCFCVYLAGNDGLYVQ